MRLCKSILPLEYNFLSLDCAVFCLGKARLHLSGKTRWHFYSLPHIPTGIRRNVLYFICATGLTQLVCVLCIRLSAVPLSLLRRGTMRTFPVYVLQYCALVMWFLSSSAAQAADVCSTWEFFVLFDVSRLCLYQVRGKGNRHRLRRVLLRHWRLWFCISSAECPASWTR